MTNSDDAEEQADGQKVLGALLEAVAINQDSLEKAEELVGRRAKLLLHYHDGGFVRVVKNAVEDEMGEAA
ncbi:hypothetical protein NKH36_03080 [Mesorhizobium sp. M1312]|uniref:hypothetical protein n=1 Tax=unclassified Mesorhizobium TaxID=325217 RepID=UPI003338CF0B